MSCGCASRCSCTLNAGSNISITGSGDVGNPYTITAAPETVFVGANTDGAVAVIPGGVDGHSPIINLVLDPASPAALSTSVDGLYVGCCTGGGGTDNNNTISVAANYAIVAGTDNTVLVDITAGNVTVTLPAAPTTGDTYVIMDRFGLAAGPNVLTVDTADAATINGSATYVFSINFESIEVRAFGGNWYVV